VRLQEHFDQMKPACVPTTEWWLMVSIIQSLAGRIEKTVLSLQRKVVLFQEQRQQFAGLAVREEIRLKKALEQERRVLTYQHSKIVGLIDRT
jgi:hypothetical protein